MTACLLNKNGRETYFLISELSEGIINTLSGCSCDKSARGSKSLTLGL